jgi:hypothetical protein
MWSPRAVRRALMRSRAGVVQDFIRQPTAASLSRQSGFWLDSAVDVSKGSRVIYGSGRGASGVGQARTL